MKTADALAADYVLGRYYEIFQGAVRVEAHWPATEMHAEYLVLRVLRTQTTVRLPVATWRDLIDAGAIVDA